MLGPVRFNHIETCTREACRTFRLKDEVEEHVTTLRSLDDILDTLRAELATVKGPSRTNDNKVVSKKPDYKALLESSDVDKVKRLINAREKAIESVKLSIQKERDGARNSESSRGGDGSGKKAG